MTNPLNRLLEFGQSPWLDNIRRGFTRGGGLRTLVDDDSLRGETSNPTIFDKAIGESDEYDAGIKELVDRGVTSPHDVLDALIAQDIREACDVFAGVYAASGRTDGLVSIELPPDLARQTEASIVEGRRLWKLVDRPNVMVKVPATSEGMPVIRTLVSEGLNINITLMFGAEYYERVIDAYLSGLEDRVARKQPIGHLASVASCFVSRIDTEADKRIGAAIASSSDPAKRATLQSMLGKTAIANSKRLYGVYLRSLASERFKALEAAGAKRQRPLWASTSTKNPAYPDTYYVEALIGPDTIDTMPMTTIDAFRDHGKVARTLDQGLAQCETELAALEAAGISVRDITDKLLDDGIVLFQASWDQLREVVRAKIDTLTRAAATAKS